MKFGGVIVAAGLSSRMKSFKPMLELSNSTVINKSINTLKLAGVSPIVVVTGYQNEILEKHLKKDEVITIFNKDFANGDMFISAKMGLDHIKELCDYVFFTPADIPLFSLETITKLMGEVSKNDYDIVVPSFNHKSGHPILINKKIISDIINYCGDNGLKGAIKELQIMKHYINVDDEGITLDADYQEDYEKLKSYAKIISKNETSYISIDISFNKYGAYFDKKLYKLLKQIETNNSINQSCKELKMAFTTAYKRIRIAESNLGFKLLICNQGGQNGGNSFLTPEGTQYILKYEKFINEAEFVINNLYENIYEQPLSENEINLNSIVEKIDKIQKPT